MEQLPEAGFVGAIAAVNLLGQLIKMTPLGELLRAWLPVVLEVLGFGIGMLLGLDWFVSLFVGAAAMGIYSGVKHTVTELKQ